MKRSGGADRPAAGPACEPHDNEKEQEENKMKKITAILCALLIACLAGSAFAEDVPVSSLYRPVLPETFKTLVAGKTFEAEVVRKECYGEDEDAFWMISVTAAEETRFAAEDVENMKVNDIVAFAPGQAVMIMEKTADEFGF